MTRRNIEDEDRTHAPGDCIPNLEVPDMFR